MNGRMKGGLLAAFGACGFLEGCSFLSDSLNRPVREYFEYNTETAAITHYEIAGGSWRLDPEGAVNVSSEGDLRVAFYLRNPQRFVFSSGGQSGNLLLDFPAAPDAAVKSEAAVSQDGSDAAVITLVCPAHFLRASDCGGDISPEIRLLHPASRVDFGTYAAARFIANSPPPPVRGAAVYHDSVDGVYVICFNMPAAQLLADGTGIHRDICRLAVNGRWFDVSVQDGRLSFSGSQFSVPADGAVPPHLRKAAETAAEFLPDAGRAVYFTTGDAVSDGGMAYEISYADRRGLTEPSSVSAQSRRLDGVTIFGSDGAPLADGAIVPPDAGSLFATVALAPPERTPDGAGSAADALVVYEVYQGTDVAGVLIASGQPQGRTEVRIPCGQAFIRAVAHKDWYVDSLPLERRIVVSAPSSGGTLDVPGIAGVAFRMASGGGTLYRSAIAADAAAGTISFEARSDGGGLLPVSEWSITVDYGIAGSACVLPADISSDTNEIQFIPSLPAGTYFVFVSAVYENVRYGASFTILLEESPLLEGGI